MYITKNSFFVAVCIILLMSCGKQKTTDNTIKNDKISVKLSTVEKITAAEPVTASGIISSSTEARLAFKTGGVIEKIFVNEGDKIVKGQLLAKLNMTEINAQVNQAKEALAKVERDKKRVENLYKDSVATLEQLQNINTAYNVAKQTMDIAYFNQHFSEIRATTGGRIIKKIMNEGELIGPGMPLFYITADGANDWIIKVGISDKDWARLNKDDMAEVSLDAFKNEKFSAKITNKAPSIDPQSGLYPMELKFVQAPKQLALGLFTTVKMQPKTARTYLAVPIDAIIEGNGNKAYVFIAEQGKAKKKFVETATIIDGKVLIASGVNEGEKVITDGSALLADDVAIDVVQ